MSWIKTIFINIFVLFSLLGLLLMIPPMANFAFKSIQKYVYDPLEDSRYKLPNYEDIHWAELHFKEFSNLSTSYHDTINWRRDDFSGGTINIKNGIRKTFHSNVNSPIQVWFFGGSTTWGTGVNDQNTFPSIFASKTDTDVTNFGETYYTSRQSLSYLQNLYIDPELEKKNNRLIVFYDGVNDTDLCRIELDIDETTYERSVRNILRSNGFELTKTFHQLLTFLEASLKRLRFTFQDKDLNPYYDCDLDPKKADYIASTLVNIWIQANNLAKLNDHKFIAILQPVAFLGNPYTNHLDLSKPYLIRLKKQFEILYPLIRSKAGQAGINFFDLTNTYDQCKFCYIDYCHVSVEAHFLLVDEILDSIKSKPELSMFDPLFLR